MGPGYKSASRWDLVCPPVLDNFLRFAHTNSKATAKDRSINPSTAARQVSNSTAPIDFFLISAPPKKKTKKKTNQKNPQQTRKFRRPSGALQYFTIAFEKPPNLPKKVCPDRSEQYTLAPLQSARVRHEVIQGGRVFLLGYPYPLNPTFRAALHFSTKTLAWDVQENRRSPRLGQLPRWMRRVESQSVQSFKESQSRAPTKQRREKTL